MEHAVRVAAVERDVPVGVPANSGPTRPDASAIKPSNDTDAPAITMPMTCGPSSVTELLATSERGPRIADRPAQPLNELTIEDPRRATGRMPLGAPGACAGPLPRAQRSRTGASTEVRCTEIGRSAHRRFRRWLRGRFASLYTASPRCTGHIAPPKRPAGCTLSWSPPSE